MAPVYDMALRSQALTLKINGFSNADITSQTGISARGVQDLFKRARERGFDPNVSMMIKNEYVVDGKRSGRPRKGAVKELGGEVGKDGEGNDGGDVVDEVIGDGTEQMDVSTDSGIAALIENSRKELPHAVPQPQQQTLIPQGTTAREYISYDENDPDMNSATSISAANKAQGALVTLEAENMSASLDANIDPRLEMV